MILDWGNTEHNIVDNSISTIKSLLLFISFYICNSWCIDLQPYYRWCDRTGINFTWRNRLCVRQGLKIELRSCIEKTPKLLLRAFIKLEESRGRANHKCRDLGSNTLWAAFWDCGVPLLSVWLPRSPYSPCSLTALPPNSLLCCCQVWLSQWTVTLALVGVNSDVSDWCDLSMLIVLVIEESEAESCLVVFYVFSSIGVLYKPLFDLSGIRKRACSARATTKRVHDANIYTVPKRDGEIGRAGSVWLALYEIILPTGRDLAWSCPPPLHAATPGSATIRDIAYQYVLIPEL